MSYPQKLELEQVCICPKQVTYRPGGVVHLTPVRNHQDDCPLFNDTSTGEDAYADYQLTDAEYVF